MKLSAHRSQCTASGRSRRHVLDARKLLCPMPVIRLQNFVSGASSGDVVEVLCTDPGACSDIPAWCRINGHQLVSIDDQHDELVITVKVGGLMQRHP
ncbi:MAG: sulfurtransferase TusA family protein [Gammaproteobacteria bacterium]|nr:sulfurtransferase TusA family protein [Gammaproteobacteria bacterium]